MRKRTRLVSAVWAIVIVVTAALLHLAGSTAAQQKTDQTLFTLFPSEESVDPAPKELARLAAAIRQAKGPRECPLGELTIYTPRGDELFQKSLSDARRDVVLQALEGQGLAVAGRLFVKQEWGSPGKFDVGYSAARDDIPPTLDVTWTPKKGTKVKAGRRITAKAVARDDADRWQTGINTIDLDVQGGGSFGSHDYPRPPCANPPPPRTLEGVYIVPSDPPPIVRLRAVTKDFAGHDARDIAEFPTGDWYGQIIWSVFNPGGEGHHGTLDIAVSYDGRGNLTGRAVGEDQLANSSCPIIISTPARTSAKVVGQYTPSANTMSLQFAESETVRTMGVFTCAGGGGASYYPVAAGVGLGGVLNNLTVSATRSVDAERVRPQGETTLRVSLKLRHAQD